MVFHKFILFPNIASASKVVIASLGCYLIAAADVAANPKGDPWGAVVAIVFGSAGLSAVAFWQRIKMAQIQVEAERRRLELERDGDSRKMEMASLNDRISGQDTYIRDLELKLRDMAQERERWKTLYEQIRPTTTTTTIIPSPPGSGPK